MITDKLWELVALALGVLALIAGVGCAYYYAKAAHLEVKVAEQENMIREAKTVNAKCAADAQTQNDKVNGWLKASSDAAATQAAAAKASAAAVQGLLGAAANMLTAKAPADPKQDCAALESMVDAELKRRGK